MKKVRETGAVFKEIGNKEKIKLVFFNIVGTRNISKQENIDSINEIFEKY